MGMTSSIANSQALNGTGSVGTYTATCDEPNNVLSIGNHNITAIFSGDTNYFPATGLLPIQTVDQAGATTTLITSPGSTVTLRQ